MPRFGREPRREVVHPVAATQRARGFLDSRVRGARQAVADIVGDGPGKRKGSWDTRPMAPRRASRE